jgi:GTP 3',8-cyclase
MPTTITDLLQRPMRSLRVSVTDRCNLRCQYCMPEDHYVWLRREDILAFEEIAALIEIFADLGVERVRLTGGEPLLRHDLNRLVHMISAAGRTRDLSLTTNGVLLARQARTLRDAGLHRVTISLDTLHADRFQALTRSPMHRAVIEGLRAARDAGFEQIKINSVIVRGVNDDEIPSLIQLGREAGATVRFIEYMDVGGATRWAPEKVVTRAEMLAIIERAWGPVTPQPEGPQETNPDRRSRPPAERFTLRDGTTFGIISSTTQPFCRSCDRSRLTTDGLWFLCLYAAEGIDLKALLRSGAPVESIRQTIRESWEVRSDRGAEKRFRMSSRGILLSVDSLRQDPHQEMHTRGG